MLKRLKETDDGLEELYQEFTMLFNKVKEEYNQALIYKSSFHVYSTPKEGEELLVDVKTNLDKIKVVVDNVTYKDAYNIIVNNRDIQEQLDYANTDEGEYWNNQVGSSWPTLIEDPTKLQEAIEEFNSSLSTIEDITENLTTIEQMIFKSKEQ